MSPMLPRHHEHHHHHVHHIPDLPAVADVGAQLTRDLTGGFNAALLKLSESNLGDTQQLVAVGKDIASAIGEHHSVTLSHEGSVRLEFCSTVDIPALERLAKELHFGFKYLLWILGTSIGIAVLVTAWEILR